MKCAQCGAQLADGDRFCGECGNQIGAASQVAPQYGRPPPRVPVESRKSLGMIGIALIAGALVVAGVFALRNQVTIPLAATPTPTAHTPPVAPTATEPEKSLPIAPASPESEVPPAPHHFANDYAHLLKPETLARLNATLEDYERQTSNQFLLAIFERLPASKDESAFALEAFRAWRPGQAGVNNGAILFVFVQNRKIRISVGRGLEQALPNDFCKHITADVIAPAFKAGNFDGGVLNGMQAMMTAAKDAYHGNGRTHAQQQTSPNHP